VADADGSQPRARPQQPEGPSVEAPPFDEEAERAVLGAMLNDLVAVRGELGPMRLEPDHFYRDGHRAILRAILELEEAKTGVEPVTVRSRMLANGTLALIESGAYLSRLARDVPTTTNVLAYATAVREHATRREILAFGREIARVAQGDVTNVGALVDDVARRALAISTAGQDRSVAHIADILEPFLLHLEDLSRRPTGGLTGVPSGFPSLDRVTAGWQRSDLIILAARPAMGKTAFALNLLANAARDRRTPTAGVIFSLEMAAQQLVGRIWSAHAQVPGDLLRTGRLGHGEWSRLQTALVELGTSPIFVDDTPQISVPEVLRKCRQLKAEHDIGLVMVDYLQLMRGTSGGRNSSREQEIAEISRGLKALAKELAVPVIALSQLNRGVESRKDKRPMLSDLRESGAIEQDADIVMFLHRDDYYRDDEKGDGAQARPANALSPTEVIIAKHRAGATDTVNLLFEGRYMRFADPGPPSGRDDGSLAGSATAVDVSGAPGMPPAPGAYPPPPGPEEDDEV
jgi:replicative DNA helicase